MTKIFLISFLFFGGYLVYSVGSFVSRDEKVDVIKIVSDQKSEEQKELFDSMKKVQKLQKNKRSKPQRYRNPAKETADYIFASSKFYQDLKAEEEGRYSEYYYRAITYIEDTQLRTKGAIVKNDVDSLYQKELSESPNQLLDSVIGMIYLYENNPHLQFELFQKLAGEAVFREDLIDHLSRHISQLEVTTLDYNSEEEATIPFVDQKIDLLFRLSSGSEATEEMAFDMIMNQDNPTIQKKIVKSFFWDIDDTKMQRLIENLGEDRARLLLPPRLPASTNAKESADEI